MSSAEAEPGEQPAPAAGPSEQSERVARAVIVSVGVLAVYGIVVAFPYIAYFVAGIGACRGWQKTRGWLARRSHATEAGAAANQLDIAAALGSLLGDDRGVLLTALRDELKLPDTKAVKALLGQADIPWRAGVRTRAGNGPGVHRDDIAALSPSPGDGPGGGVVAGEDANTNANNTPVVERREGMTIIRMPGERRHYAVGEEVTPW